MMTAWGYEISGDLEPIIGADAFNEITGNAYASNSRVAAAVSAASQAIRNYCGWHIAPSLECTAYPIPCGKLLRLPAAYVSDVAAVYENDAALTTGQYEWRRDGLMHRCGFTNWANAWDGITVDYTAGYDVVSVPDLIEAVCSIASGVLAVSAGVMSESADGVSISYSANASSIAASLTSQQKSALEPYRVVDSHAA